MYAVDIEMDDLPIKQWVPRAILVVSFGLLVYRFGQVFYRIATGRNHRLNLSDEAAEALRLQAEMGEQERKDRDRP